jgi:hypothetical protein
MLSKIKTRSRAPIADVGDAGGFKYFRPSEKRIEGPGIGFAGDGVQDVADKAQGGVFGERVHHGGVGVGEQDHVGFVDALKTPDARPVEAQALFEFIGIEIGGRYRKVLPQSRHVDELEIDDRYFVFFRHL